MKNAMLNAFVILLSAGLGLTVSGQQRNGGPGVPVNRPAPPSVVGAPMAVAISVVQTPRPLAAAAEKLQAKYRVPILYEDLPWVNSADIMQAGDIPDPRNLSLKGVDMPVPSIGNIDVLINIDSATKLPITLLDKALNDVLTDHLGRRNPGEFRVTALPDGYGYLIGPNRVKNRDGQMIAATSPLDARISFPAGERTLQATLDAICLAVGNAKGKSLPIATSPRTERQLTIGASNEVARDVLVRTFQAFGLAGSPKLYYQLNYDIKLGYVLNVQQVTDEKGYVFFPEWMERGRGARRGQ